jgi:RES domain
MIHSKRVHDRAILDALDAIDPKPFEGTVWRIARKDREPLRGSSTHGRWSPNGEFEVLYTSLERDGALAEVGYRLSLEPVWPSLIQHEIHRIQYEPKKHCTSPTLLHWKYWELILQNTKASLTKRRRR